jgi:hypothetical protein
MPASCLASLSPPLEVTFRILSARGFHARRLGINRPVATVPSGSAAASTDPWQEEVAMAEPTVVIAPTTVPREDLGHGEPLLMTAVG